MNADSSVNVAVAENVFGWKRQRQEKHPQGWRDERGFHYLDARPWSTDLSAAWEIVERLSPTKPFELTDVGSFNPGMDFSVDRWQATFGEVYSVTAPTVPLAICLAALESVGVKTAASH